MRVFIFIITILLSSFSAFAYWKDDFPATPFETVTSKKIDDLEKKVKTLIPSCTERLEKNFGKTWKRNRHGFPRLLSVHVARATEAVGMEEFAVTYGNFFIGINFNPYSFLSGHADLETTVCHEMVHAYFRKHMNFGSYSRLPRWAREGSAVYLVNQLAHKEIRALYRLWSQKSALLNGLEGEHNFEDYFEDALAFTFLHDKYSADHRVLALILEGKDIYEAIEQSTGLNKEAFLREALSFAQSYVALKFQSLDKKTRDAIDRWAKPVERQKAGLEFMRQFKDGINQTTLPNTLDFKISLAFSLDVYAYNEDETELIRNYQRTLSEIPSFEYGQNSAGLRYKLAGLYLHSGDYNKALHYYTLIFNENMELPILQQSTTAGILRAYVGLTDWRKVLAWSERERGLHVSNIVEYRYYRALAYQALGDAKKARKYFELACESTMNRQFKEKACQALTR